ncbi:MAG: radical SAM protein [Pseudomonadota bacterium]
MRITLILAASLTDPLRKNDPFMPLSLPLLAAAAPGHDYRLVDLLWEDEPDYDRPTDLVGISVRFTGEKRAYEIADEYRRRGVKVVLGGPQISAVPHRAIRHADAVAVGEGELTWPVIVKHAERGSLEDFYVCGPLPLDAGDRSVHRIDSYVDLAGVPMAMRHLFSKKYVFDTVFAARGCPIDCDFCSVTRLFGKKYRTRPIDNVIAEIETFRNYYYLLDDSVFGKPVIYDYYLDLYDAVAGLKKTRFWTGQANLDAAADPKGRNVIKKAARSGLIYAAIGMESINPATLKSSGAFAKAGASSADRAVEQMKENIRFIQDQGIIISGWFIIGYEDDTIDTYYRTLDFCMEMNILPTVFPIKVLPGTRLYARLRKENKLDNSRSINFVHPTIDGEDVTRALGEIRKAGYSTLVNLKRAGFYASKFPSDKIHKTMFLGVLQSKLGSGLDVSRDEFYYNPDDVD